MHSRPGVKIGGPGNLKVPDLMRFISRPDASAKNTVSGAENRYTQKILTSSLMAGVILATADPQIGANAST